MENKNIGYLIIGISILIGFIIFSFNKALREMVAVSCTHGPECPMWGTINFQTNISVGIMIFVLLIGLFLIFSHKFKRKASFLSKEKYNEIIKSLDSDEKIIFNLIFESKGSIFQSILVEKSNLSKVKITRTFDRLEGKNIIERKRRGMTNIVILKQ